MFDTSTDVPDALRTDKDKQKTGRSKLASRQTTRKHYAIVNGLNGFTGIVETWDEAHYLTNRVSGVRHKSFRRRHQALQYLERYAPAQAGGGQGGGEAGGQQARRAPTCTCQLSEQEEFARFAVTLAQALPTLPVEEQQQLWAEARGQGTADEFRTLQLAVVTAAEHGYDAALELAISVWEQQAAAAAVAEPAEEQPLEQGEEPSDGQDQ